MNQNRVLHFYTLIYTFLVLMVVACNMPEKEMVQKTPPYVVLQPLDKPELFGEGIISTPLPEFATSFSPQGDTVYFNIANEDRSILKIVKSTFTNGRWSEPERLPFSDGTYRDVDPFVTHDGSRLYFSSNRPVRKGESKDDFDTWYVELRAEGWSEPINPGTPLNGEGSEIFVSTTKSGTIYFTAFDEGVGHIYRARESDGTYHIPERITLGLQDSISVGNPMVAPDESFLIFSSTMLPGEGGSDLFVSTRTEKGNWGEIKNLGSFVNSSYADFAPAISPDGQYLFFTSERPGVVGAVLEGRPPGDLYQVLISKIIP